MKYPQVLTEAETLERAIKGASLARFGDGELRVAVGGRCISQKADPGCAQEFRAMLAKPHANCLVCIPNANSATPKKVNWETYAEPHYTKLYRAGVYGSSFITRPDSAPWIDKPVYWDRVRDLWRGKDVTLVAGDKKSITAEMMSEAASVREVWGPRRDAYVEVDRLFEEIGKPSGPVILCLGCTATALAHRLAHQGVHALDLGHMGMFMRHAGAYAHARADLVSDDYREQLAAKHAVMRWGVDGHRHAQEILDFASELGAESILDYGCGHGTLGKALAPRRVQEYDPGIPGKHILPKPADLVVATDVLEHIEPNKLDAVLDHIRRLARSGIYLVVSLRPAREVLPDGRNAHLIVETPTWWLEQLIGAGYRIERQEVRTALHVWCVP